jgi:crossover junction endonuclease MUS81
MSETTRKRVTVKPKRPNLLFEQWLTEWRDKAKQNESKMQFCFSLALKSLKKYPLPLETGKDCKILNGFGEKLCKMLDDKLMQYKATNGSFNSNIVESPIETKIKKTKVNPQQGHSKEYIPQYRSGAFAILVTLYEKNHEQGFASYLTKNEIITNGQHLCNVSFTKPEVTTRYTVWSAMKSLLEKKLVTKQGNPARFSLTDEGAALGDKLYIQLKIEEFQKQENEEKPSCSNVLSIEKTVNSVQEAASSLQNNINNIQSLDIPIVPKKTNSVSHKTSTNSSQSSINNEAVILAPNSFELILLVDTQEVSGNRSSEDDPTLVELKKNNVQHEVRNLKVGDYVWICRDNTSKVELVLPYIIERKRMDDFGKSIKDDRFHEQKFRLKQCGLQKLIYLIESYGRNEHVGLPITTLYQAATNTLIQDGFIVKFTETGKATYEYLVCLTNFIINLFKNKTLVSCQKEDLPELAIDDDLIPLMHFQDFNKSSSKIRVRYLFLLKLYLLDICSCSILKSKKCL